MGDVQEQKEKKTQFTMISNVILEELAKIKLSPTQYRLIFVIWRYTFGFNRNEHDLSLRFLSNATGCDSRQIQRELKKLEQRKIIVQNIQSGKYRKISFNENVNEWVVDSTIGKTTIGEIDNGESDKARDGEIVNGGVGETVKASIGETTNQEIQSLNTSLNKTLNKDIIPYSEIINYLNEKADKNYRTSTKKTQTLIKARWNEGFRLDDFKKVIDTKVSQWKHDPKMNTYLRPETLFGTKFEGYLNEQLIVKRNSLHDIPTERPNDWQEPKPLTEEELKEVEEIMDELDLPF